MINFIKIIALTGLVSLWVSACEKASDDPPGPLLNPFISMVDWNGFIIDTIRYQTPRAYLENWGENLDSLSSDYDIKITDGTFNNQLRDVSDYSILVYFDANSSSINELSEGVYTFENTPERKPGNIVEAWIELKQDGKLYKYKVTQGTVTVKKQDGFILITYDAILNNSLQITGQYTGNITTIEQVLN